MEFGGTASELRKAQPQYVMSKKKIEIGSANPDQIVDQIEQNHRDLTIDKIDGLKIETPDSWVQIRKSNTEPIIRVMSEAKSREAAEALCDAYLNEIKNFGE